MMGGTTKPMRYFIRKHNAVLNGFDHTGAFLRMEENIGSTGHFVEGFQVWHCEQFIEVKILS